jgi:hypothetical protein
MASEYLITEYVNFVAAALGDGFSRAGNVVARRKNGEIKLFNYGRCGSVSHLSLEGDTHRGPQAKGKWKKDFIAADV